MTKLKCVYTNVWTIFGAFGAAEILCKNDQITETEMYDIF